MSAQLLQNLFALLAFLAFAIAVASWVAFFVARRNETLRVRLSDDLGPALRIAALCVATVTTLGSLYYSEVRGYPPCELCWLQRDLMYPLVIVLLVGIVRRTRPLVWYVAPFVILGPLVSGYHMLVENVAWFAQGTECPVAACTEPPIRVFAPTVEFVTLAFMALTAFLAIGGLVALDALVNSDLATRVTPARVRSIGARSVALAVAAVVSAMGLWSTQFAGDYPSDPNWYLRVAFYPLAILFAVAVVRRDAGLAWFTTPFVAAGFALALWQATAPGSGFPGDWWGRPAAVALVLVAVLIVLDARGAAEARDTPSPLETGDNGGIPDSATDSDLEVSR